MFRRNLNGLRAMQMLRATSKPINWQSMEREKGQYHSMGLNTLY